LRTLVAYAFLHRLYSPDEKFLISGPNQLDSEHFDLEARAEGNPTIEQRQQMMQALLEERFKLVMHHETRQLPLFELALVKAGKTGPQLIADTADTKCWDPSGPPPSRPSTGLPPPPCGILVAVTLQRGGSPTMLGDLSMEKFAENLSGLIDRVVVDHTGLSGNYSLTMAYTPEAGLPGSQTGAGAAAPDSSDPPSLITALREQLGLKLESTTGPVDVLVIDHIEEPSPN
jgi:uncharacterized protein (TIGR03435 family)